MKKTLKLLTVMILVIAAGSLVMLGCANPADGSAGAPGQPGDPGGTGGTGPSGSSVVSGDVTAAALQRLVDRGNPILIAADSEVGAGYVDLKDANIIVEAALTFDSTGVILKALTADIDIGSGGSLDTTDAIIIVPAEDPEWVSKATVDPGTLAKVTVLDEDDKPVFSGDLVALENYTVTATAGDIPNGKELVVYGTLTVPATAAKPTGDITAIGTIDVTGNNDVALATGTTIDYANATITSSTGGVTITTGGTGSFDVASGKDITLTNTSFTGTVEGSGALKFSGNVTAVDISGSGKVEFITGAPAFATSESKFPAGGVIFNTAAGSTEVTLTFNGPVEFKGNFVRTSSSSGGEYTFKGDVTIASGKAITLGGADTVTFAEGVAVKVGADTVLEAGEDGVEITPTDGAKLTAAANKISVGTQNIEITSGVLAVSGTLEATDKDIKIAKDEATLVLAPDGTIITGTNGTITLGPVVLSGAGSWKAGAAAAIMLAHDDTDLGILGDGSNAILTAGGTPTLTLDKGGKSLLIGPGTEIALGGTTEAAVGKIVVGYGTASKIVFGGLGAKISAVANTTTTAAAGGVLTANSTSVGNKLEVYSTASSGGKLGYITPANNADFDSGIANVTISGPTSSTDLTLASTSAVN